MKLTAHDKEILREQFEKAWQGRQDMIDYCVKKTSGYIIIDGIMVTYDKPTIQTDFWFGEHTYDYDEVVEYAHKCSESERYFLARNLDALDGFLSALDDPHATAYIAPGQYYGQSDDCILGYVTVRKWEKPDNPQAREMTADQKAAYREFILNERAKFEKRLHTYLKRYGLSKCHYGVFWADR